MTKSLSKLTVGFAALMMTATLAIAQTAPATAPPAAAPKAPPAATAKAPVTKGVPKKASTPEGIACSAQADEKKLTGKERKSFRGKCIRDLKKAAAGKAAPAPATKKN